MSDVTRILSEIEQGEPGAAERLLPLVYHELQRLASAKMAQEKPGQTLQATALVHEAYLRLVGGSQPSQWNSRGHFFAAAAEAIRRILIDAARRKRSLRAGGVMQRVCLDDVELPITHAPDDLLALDEALDQLIDDDPVAGQLAKLRLYAGMSVEEAAENLGISRRTGFRHWTYARAFLQLRTRSDDPGSNES